MDGILLVFVSFAVERIKTDLRYCKCTNSLKYDKTRVKTAPPIVKQDLELLVCK